MVSLAKFVKTNEMLEATADDSTPPAGTLENCPTQKDADGTKILYFTGQDFYISIYTFCGVEALSNRPY